MGELEELKKEIENYCSNNNLILYAVDGNDLTAGATIDYVSGDYKDFLKIAEKLNVKLIYYQEAFGETKEEEVAEIYLGFAYNGILHALSIMASWYEKELKEEYGEEQENEENNTDVRYAAPKPNSKEGINYIKEKPEEAIKVDFLEFIKKEYPEIFKGDVSIHDIYTLFLESKGIHNTFTFKPRIRAKTEKAKEAAEAEITKERFEKEKILLPELTEECVKWAKSLGLKKVIIPILYTFLKEKRIDLTNLGFDVLKTQVNNQLKK